MSEDERFQIIWENAQKMPEMEKAMFYELERKKLPVGMLMVLLFFAGGGLIYAGKAAKGTILMLVDAMLLAVSLSLRGFGPISFGEALGSVSLIPIPFLLALYIYTAWDVRRTIVEYNKRLYVTVFDRSP
ncbi:MAG TPA: hypothetical protein PLM24_01845 [Methanothrix sp.]|nr:hypothetical protein [Methanothrix sp.]HPJ84643.1 hypothetical protein [Methanothrix sp.]HPR65862.1 hypothetical protein [Methanothrix sp.]